jgi:hypothetical protein
MTIKHPIDGETCYDTDEAPLWYTEHGLPTSPGGLASKRTNGGGGPRWFKLGKRVYYRESALREDLVSRITQEVRSTSELKGAKRLLIEDKSSEPRPNGGDNE